jgi:hypothetical protein
MISLVVGLPARKSVTSTQTSMQRLALTDQPDGVVRLVRSARPCLISATSMSGQEISSSSGVSIDRQSTMAAYGGMSVLASM